MTPSKHEISYLHETQLIITRETMKRSSYRIKCRVGRTSKSENMYSSCAMRDKPTELRLSSIVGAMSPAFTLDVLSIRAGKYLPSATFVRSRCNIGPVRRGPEIDLLTGG